MSAPIKPKAGGVNLFLTRGEFDDLKAVVTHYSQIMNLLGNSAVPYFEKSQDLLTVIQSQSKESSNDS